MKQTLFALVLSIAVLPLCNAQKIETEKVFGGYTYTQDGENLKMNQLVKTMESNQQAFDLIKKAQSSNTLASVFGFAGGGLVGWPVGTAIGGGDANWVLAGVGAGLIAIAIPISMNANKKANEAVDIYNASLNTTSYQEVKTEFNIIGNAQGVGLSIRF